MENMLKLYSEFIASLPKCSDINCENKATLMCDRCFENYCSKYCQLSDWPLHKQYCRPMPLLVPYESFSKATPPCLGVMSENEEEEPPSNEENVLVAQKSDNPEKNEKTAQFQVEATIGPVSFEKNEGASGTLRKAPSIIGIPTGGKMHCVEQLLALNDYEIKILKISNDGQSALVQCPYKLDFISKDLKKAIGRLQTFTITEEAFVCAAHTAGGWRRAVIIDTLPGGGLHLIYAIDEGCLRVSDKLKCLPDRLEQFPACVFVITAEGVKGDLKKCRINGQLGKIEILKVSEKKFILYCNKNRICQIYLKSYFDDKQFCHKMAIGEIIANGSYVYITKLATYDQIFINSSDSKKYPSLFDALADKCSKYQEERPTIHDIVLVKTNGEQYYRGKIMQLSSTENNDVYDVFNIDTANLHESVHVETMFKACNFIRYLPRHLQVLNITSPTTSALLDLLNECIQEKTLLQILYSDNSFSEGNLLFLNKIDQSMELSPLLYQESIDSVNDQSTADTLTNDDNYFANANDNGDRKLLLKGWKNFHRNENIFKSLPLTPPAKAKTRMKGSDEISLMKHLTKKKTFEHFTMKHVQFKKLPNDRNIEIIIVDDSNLKTYGFVSCAHFKNTEEIIQFKDNLDKVHAYGLRVQKEIPQDFITEIGELCVAYLNNHECWYRAQCLSHDDDDMITIIFLDLGISRKMHKSQILPISKDLLYSVYGNFCYIDGYKTNEPNPEIDNYIVTHEKRLKCRHVTSLGEEWAYSIKIDM